MMKDRCLPQQKGKDSNSARQKWLTNLQQSHWPGWWRHQLEASCVFSELCGQLGRWSWTQVRPTVWSRKSRKSSDLMSADTSVWPIRTQQVKSGELKTCEGSPTHLSGQASRVTDGKRLVLNREDRNEERCLIRLRTRYFEPVHLRCLSFLRRHPVNSQG